MKIAIITGASSGMGREFVIKLDKSESFDEIWVIARRREALEELAKETKAKAENKIKLMKENNVKVTGEHFREE